MIKTLTINLLLLLAVILAFDLISYALLPNRMTATFPEYRNDDRDNRPIVPGRGKFSRGYYVTDSTSGFDIGSKKTGTHWVDGLEYKIWSNSLGCFDTEHNLTDDYIYLAGDSQTWGYTPFEQKFGTLLEQNIGKDILKCGIAHTGQRHQLAKLQKVVAQTSLTPKAIWVVYSPNDVANDYAYPHTVVIDGWSIDSAALNGDNEIIRYSTAELTSKLRQKQQQARQKRAQPFSFKKFLRKYSLSTHLLKYSIKESKKQLAGIFWKTQVNHTDEIKNLYQIRIEKNGRFFFEKNRLAGNNKKALRAFKQYARDNGSQLTVILLPPKGLADDELWYSELEHFLRGANIRYLNLAQEFKARGLNSADLYWNNDGHLNPTGNKAVATILTARYNDLLQ